MDTVKTLRDARSLIDKFGWNNTELGSRESGFCALGAVIYSSQFVREQINPIRLLMLSGPMPDRMVVEQNDLFIKSKEECLAWFDRAIALAQKDTSQHLC